MKRANVAIAVATMTIAMVAFANAVAPGTAPGGGGVPTNEGQQFIDRPLNPFPHASAPIDVLNPNARVLKILPRPW
jgi:hypothetical protein